MATTKSTTTTTTRKRKTTAGTKINVKADLLKIGGSLIAAILVAGGTKIKNDWDRKQELKSELKSQKAKVKQAYENDDPDKEQQKAKLADIIDKLRSYGVQQPDENITILER